ncbi:aldehyde ferredoxin oxidoreductase family protein [Halorubrum salsamenti]|uniref:aldehyde ferredoxin oxidoreductase family protein n=1 Tax=Halorubrum salsamenti TaxID=2583990 RepID=UPI0011AA40C7|nr:aldehyde ferredoxin oxidoreductase C-terminal domain-containing protein [Halorubrum salsamenti]
MLHSTGPLVSVDVGDETVSETDITDVQERYIGGRGVATRLAHERIPFDADPLGSENRVVFTTGPMQASQMSFTGRANCTALSPLTDGLLSSNAGGFVSRHLAATGYGAIELAGASDELTVVHVRDDGVEFEPVPDLAGATVSETTDYLDSEHDISSDRTAVIGPAGENEVRFASIMTTEERAFGRGGLGAVLGSKNVKAVTFGGDSAPDHSISTTANEIHREAATDDNIMKRQGTVAVMDLANEMDGLPSYYFSEQSFDGVEGINGAAVAEKKYKKGTCSACAFACKLPTRDEARGVETEGPEFEVAMAFGSNSGIDDIVDVMKSNQLCDDYGLDAISTGNTIAAYLAANDEFGNEELIWDLVEQIAYREDTGDLLADGIGRVHDELGVENWSVKNLDFAAHEGRVLHGQALSYAVANRGADHMYSVFYSVEYPLVDEDQAMRPVGFDGKAERLVKRENQMAVNDSGVVCKFSRDYMTPQRYELLFDADFDELLDVGGRIVTLERHFNNQRGFDRGDDRLPYEDELPGFEAALDDYYDARGWDDDGTVPETPVAQ